MGIPCSSLAIESEKQSFASDGVLQPHQKRFLLCFAATGSILRAARWAKIHRQTHYDWLNNTLGNATTYAEAFRTAELQATRTLEDEAVRRAHEGVRRAVRHKGKIVGYESVCSDSLMMFLLKGMNPEKYRDRHDIRHGDPDGKPLLPLAALDQLFASDDAEPG